MKDWQFWLGLFGWNPIGTGKTIRTYYRRAVGRMDNEWWEFVLPESNDKLRREHRNWARFTLIGHALVAVLFIATGHWFLIFIFDLGSQYCGWLGFLCRISAALRNVARCSRSSALLPDVYLLMAAGVPLLEHAVSRGTPHVSRSAVF